MFSNSARVMTFLTAVSRYQVKVSHIAGEKIPFTDFASRNIVECSDKCCQVCKFVQEFSEQVVRSLTVHDVFQSQGMARYSKGVSRSAKVTCVLTTRNSSNKKDEQNKGRKDIYSKSCDSKRWFAYCKKIACHSKRSMSALWFPKV